MKKIPLILSLLSTISFTSLAAEAETPLQVKLSKVLKTQIEQISPTPIEGLLEVITSKGLVYVTADGEYLLQGELLSLSKLTNLTEESMAKQRLKGLKAYEDTMIVYPAKDQKHVVTVFTDIDCGYCRKLHQEIEEYNKLGITVRYLAFPRGGKRSRAFAQMEAVWCAENPAKALTAAKKGEKIESKQCDNPVAAHYALGNKFGVRGTPAIVLENGTMIPGYLPPAQLLEELEKSND